MNNWHRFKRDCPICQGERKDCRKNTQSSIIHCRASQAHPAGFRLIGEDAQGFFMWIESSLAEDQAWQEKLEAHRQQQEAERQAKLRRLLPIAERDRQFKTIARHCGLSLSHRAKLKQRGLSSQLIEAAYLSSVFWTWQNGASIPGVTSNLPGTDRKGRLRSYPSGFAIAVSNERGQVLGAQLRIDAPGADAAKYLWLSSESIGGNGIHLPNGEVPIGFYRPFGAVDRAEINVAEGFLKPFIVAQRFGVICLGAASANFASSPELFRRYLEAASSELGTKLLILNADAGSVANPHVIGVYRRCWELAEDWGYTVKVRWWGQVEKAAGDIDEINVATFADAKLLTIAQFEAIADQHLLSIQRGGIEQEQPQEREAKSSHDAIGSRFLRKLQRYLTPKQPKQRSVKPLPKEEFQPYVPEKLPRYAPGQRLAFEFESGQRQQFYSEAIAKGWNHILDRSPTGTFKSSTAGNLKPEQFKWLNSDGEEQQATHLFYLDQSHRNPSTQAIEENFVDLPVRHHGLAIDPTRTTATGKPHTRHIKEGETLERLPGNCYRAPLFVAAKQRGLAWAKTEADQNPICAQCPYFHTCGKPMAIGQPGQGYRAARREALQNNLIRLSPDSTPPIGFEHRLNIWEEASAVFQPAESRTATLSDFDSQWAALETQNKALFDELHLLRQKLRQLFKTQERYGLDLERIREELGDVPEWLDAKTIDAIEEAIAPTVQEVLGESHRRLKQWIERSGERFTALQSKLKAVQAQIDQHERQFGIKDFRLGDSDAIRELRQQAEQLRLEVEECGTEIAEATRQLTAAEHSRAGQQEHRAKSEQALLDTETQCLADFLRIWIGIRPGAARILQGKLILTQRNDRHLNQVRGTRNIYLDGTGQRDILSLHLGISPELLLVCRQKALAVQNIQRIQIVGFGLAGKTRAESTDRRINAALEAVFTKYGLSRVEALIIDHHAKREATGANLHHFGGRGSNEFMQKKILMNVGSPIENLGAAQDRYRVLENPKISFEQYLSSFVEAELEQEEGRLRANLRHDEKLIVVYLGDYALPFSDVEVVQAIDLVAEAGDRTQAARRKIATAICEVVATGAKLTQQAIAAAAGCYQSWISQFFAKHGGWSRWRKIISEALKSSNRATDISPAAIEGLLPEEAEMAAWLEESASEAAIEPQGFLTDLGDMELAYQSVVPDFSLDRVLNAVSAEARRVVVSTFAMLAIPQLHQLEEELVTSG